MKDLATQTRWMDATAQAELVANGDVTPVELVDAAIERMESLDGDLNALTYRWFDTAREMAGSPTLPDGPFKGVPFLLKDLHAHMGRYADVEWVSGIEGSELSLDDRHHDRESCLLYTSPSPRDS